ncbi:MAG: GWxTD domain-containing protein, partial [Bryobacteraceae bacterium]
DGVRKQKLRHVFAGRLVLALALAAAAGGTHGTGEAFAQQTGALGSMPAPFQKWLQEDIVYIISPVERAAFVRLTSDPERQRFIEQFWLRRDPSPGTAQNEYKEEHYRRIAYANQRFRGEQPGWNTHRGRIYIVYGPPDEIEAHPSKGMQRWIYREDMFAGLILEFRDLN